MFHLEVGVIRVKSRPSNICAPTGMPHTRADVHNESSVLHPNMAMHSESEIVRVHAEYSCDGVERHQRTQNNAKSPFFSKLPAEVHNTIYEMVLGV